MSEESSAPPWVWERSGGFFASCSHETWSPSTANVSARLADDVPGTAQPPSRACPPESWKQQPAQPNRSQTQAETKAVSTGKQSWKNLFFPLLPGLQRNPAQRRVSVHPCGAGRAVGVPRALTSAPHCARVAGALQEVLCRRGERGRARLARHAAEAPQSPGYVCGFSPPRCPPAVVPLGSQRSLITSVAYKSVWTDRRCRIHSFLQDRCHFISGSVEERVALGTLGMSDRSSAKPRLGTTLPKPLLQQDPESSGVCSSSQVTAVPSLQGP